MQLTIYTSMMCVEDTKRSEIKAFTACVVLLFLIAVRFFIFTQAEIAKEYKIF